MQETDPDYRFTLANERTFLAWLRTGLGLMAGAVALVHVTSGSHVSTAQRVIGVLLACLGVLVCLGSLRRWQVVQTAMRRGEDLPPSHQPIYLGVAIAAIGVAVAVLLISAGGRL